MMGRLPRPIRSFNRSYPSAKGRFLPEAKGGWARLNRADRNSISMPWLDEETQFGVASWRVLNRHNVRPKHFIVRFSGERSLMAPAVPPRCRRDRNMECTQRRLPAFRAGIETSPKVTPPAAARSSCGETGGQGAKSFRRLLLQAEHRGAAETSADRKGMSFKSYPRSIR